MMTCNINFSKLLNKLGYDGISYRYYIKNPNENWKAVSHYYENVSENTKVIACPRIDDVAHWLLDKHGIMCVIEPFIHNGIIYNFIAKIYAPTYYDSKILEHMNGKIVYDNDGMYFEKYHEALEACIKEAVKLIWQQLTKFI